MVQYVLLYCEYIDGSIFDPEVIMVSENKEKVINTQIKIVDLLSEYDSDWLKTSLRIVKFDKKEYDVSEQIIDRIKDTYR